MLEKSKQLEGGWESEKQVMRKERDGGILGDAAGVAAPDVWTVGGQGR